MGFDYNKTATLPPQIEVPRPESMILEAVASNKKVKLADLGLKDKAVASRSSIDKIFLWSSEKFSQREMQSSSTTTIAGSKFNSNNRHLKGVISKQHTIEKPHKIYT
ncbi:unnamed protein product [Vicia faba]|uniref:Uncharacterized protein n=1 Tax=Vicia faba TaxID=3906 RepID=A0AAV1ATT9_VICFA|nr:unnamed protein product [Vicia faba]